jgi:hypothetical protein
MDRPRTLSHFFSSSRRPIGRRLNVAVAIVCVLFLALTAAFLWRQGAAYRDARHSLAAFDTLRSTLVVMEKVSAERGSTNAALGAHRPLDEPEQLSIERSYGRIDQLTWLLESRVANHPALAMQSFQRVKRQYLGNGLAYVTAVRAQASAGSADAPTTRSSRNGTCP